jgi:hypothetical protein
MVACWRSDQSIGLPRFIFTEGWFYVRDHEARGQFEYRTFDRQKCGRVHTMIISSDPMDSNVRGWL